MIDFDNNEKKRFSQLCGMLGSAFEGERSNAASLASRMLLEHGYTWAEIITMAFSPAVPVAATARQSAPNYGDGRWRQIAETCYDQYLAALNPWEKEFLESILFRDQPLTQKQEACLARIAKKTGAY